MLIQNPHNLAGIHCGAAAERDDAVGLKCTHLCRAFLCACQRRVGCYIKERGVLNAHLVELIGNRLGVTVVIQEAVGDDERLLLAHNGLQLVKCNGQAALLKINLLRRSEPKHIFSPLGNGLDVDQVLDTDIFGNAVAAPGAATQRQRGRQLEVVKVADAALRGGGIHENAAGLHSLRKLIELCLLGRNIEINGRGVAVTAVRNQMLGLAERILNVLGMVHRENGREFFMRKLFGKLHALNFTNQNLRALGNIHTGELCNGVRLLTDDFRIQRAVDQNGLADLVQFIALEEVAASCGELILDRLINAVEHDDRLLGCANHTVVKGLGVDNRVDSEKHIRGVVNDRGGVARADAECRLAAGISSLHHAGAAGRENDVRFLHQEVGHFQAGHINPGDNALGCARFNRSFQHDLCSRDGGLLCSRVRADDDAVARLQRNQRLEDSGRGGVGGRDDRSNDADRLGNLLDAVGRVLFNDTAGLRILVCVVDVLSGIVVLDDLVFDHAHAGLLHCHLGKRDALLVCSRRGS